MGCYVFLQGIFPTQRSNSHLLLGRQILYQWATWEPFIPYVIWHFFLNKGKSGEWNWVPFLGTGFKSLWYKIMVIKSKFSGLKLGSAQRPQSPRCLLPVVYVRAVPAPPLKKDSYKKKHAHLFSYLHQVTFGLLDFWMYCGQYFFISRRMTILCRVIRSGSQWMSSSTGLPALPQRL